MYIFVKKGNRIFKIIRKNQNKGTVQEASQFYLINLKSITF